MNKTIYFALAILVVVAIGIVAFLSLSTSDDKMTQDDNTLVGSEEEAMMDEDEGMMNEDQTMESSRYQEYSSQKFAQASDKKRVYFFYAAWCPTCRPANEEFMANKDKIPEDVVLFRTNYDTENTLKDKYNITYQHTFVQVDENGNEVAKWNGGGLTELINNVR